MLGLGRRVLGFGCSPKEAIWWVLPFLTTNLGILGGLAGSGKVSEGLKKTS